MRIYGGDQTYRIGPTESLVVVQDTNEFMTGIVQTLRSQINDDLIAVGIEDPQKSEIIRTLKVKLYPTTLKEFPVHDVEDIVRKVINDYESYLNTGQ